MRGNCHGPRNKTFTRARGDPAAGVDVHSSQGPRGKKGRTNDASAGRNEGLMPNEPPPCPPLLMRQSLNKVSWPGFGTSRWRSRETRMRMRRVVSSSFSYHEYSTLSRSIFVHLMNRELRTSQLKAPGYSTGTQSSLKWQDLWVVSSVRHALCTYKSGAVLSCFC